MKKEAVKTAQSLLTKNIKATGHPSERSFWTLRNSVMVIIALIYIISPFDALPDWLIFIGWLDDLGIATAVLLWWKSRRKALKATPPSEANETADADEK